MIILPGKNFYANFTAGPFLNRVVGLIFDVKCLEVNYETVCF